MNTDTLASINIFNEFQKKYHLKKITQHTNDFRRKINVIFHWYFLLHNGYSSQKNYSKKKWRDNYKKKDVKTTVI